MFCINDPDIKKLLFPELNEDVGIQDPVTLGWIDSLLPVFNSVPKAALNTNSWGVEFILLPCVE